MFVIETSTPTSAVQNRFSKKMLERIDPITQGRRILSDPASRISAQTRDDLKSVTVSYCKD